MSTLFESGAPRPLADRLRPKKLSDVVGQDHLLQGDGPIARMTASGSLTSIILWVPPGTRSEEVPGGKEWMSLGARYH